MSPRVRRTQVLLAAAVVLAAPALAGCTTSPSVMGSREIAPSATAPTASIGAGARPSAKTTTGTPAAVPTLVPHGTAAQNKPYFDLVNERTVRVHRDPTGGDFVAGLAAAGFDTERMQATADKTTVGLTPGSVQFSVRLNDECLIGQYGVDIGGYHSEVAPVLQTGRCLIGTTVAIP